MIFNILATFAEFEVDLLRMRAREGMAIAKAKGKLKGKQPKLSPAQQRHMIKLHGEGEHNIAELAELFKVSRPTVYRVLEKATAASAA
jgi:DNA invertase Pin-like site-specific DNA recombinase